MRFPFWGICTGLWHGPWEGCLIVHTLHVPYLFSFWFFWCFFIKSTQISFFGHLPWKYHPTILTTIPIFSSFIVYFIGISHLEMQIFWNAYCTLKIVPPTSSLTSPYSFLIPPPYSTVIFLFSIATLSTFESIYRTLKTAPTNIVTNNGHHPLLYCYFSFSIVTLSIFGNIQWTLTIVSLLKYKLIQIK